jgi:hypothetical protein
MIKTEPVKDAILPSTSQSLPKKENVKTCDLMDKLDFDVFSSANIKNLDLDFDPEFGSLFESIIEDTVGDNPNVLSTNNDFKELNIALSTNDGLKNLNTGLSADSGLEKLDIGLSTDSFDAQARGKKANSIMSKVQPNLFAETEENKDHNLMMTESYQSGSMDICTKWAETSSYSGDTEQDITVADKYEIVSVSNQSQELASTSCYDESKHSDRTAVGQSLLNRSSSPATVTMQALDISRHGVDLETVLTNDSAVHDNLQTGDGQIMNSLQSVTERKVRVGESFNLKEDNSCSPEKSIELLSYTQISHFMTNGDNIVTENRADVMTAEVGTPGMIPCTWREVQDHSYCKVKDDDSTSVSPEKSFDLVSHDKTSHSVSTADNIVTGKSMGDVFPEASTPILTPCPLTEVQDHSYSKKKDGYTLNDQLNVATNHSVTTENSVPVMADIHDMSHTLSVTNVGDLTVEIVNMVLHDIPVAENVTLVSCGVGSVPSGTEVNEATIKELNLETNTAENMFSAMNNIACTSQQPCVTDTVIEGTVTNVNQTVTLGARVKTDKLAAEECASYTVINCIPEPAVKTMNIKSNNESVVECTDMDILERQPLTNKVRHIANSRSNVGINCSQHSVVDSVMEQKRTGNRIDLQKNKLRSQHRSRSVERKIKNDLKLDGLQYSFITNVKNQGDLTNSGRSNGAEVKNSLVDDSRKQLIPPQTENTGENSNLCIVKCRENMHCDLGKLGCKEASVMYLKPQVSSPYPPHQQNFSSSEPLSSESLAVVSHMGAKCVTTSKAKQNKRNEISALLPGSSAGSVTNDANLCNTQRNKSIRKGENTVNTSSGLKSHVFAHNIRKEKFAGFTFEKPFVPQANMRTYSKKENSSKAKRISKGMKTHTGQNKALPALTYHPCSDPSTPSTSSIDSSDRVAVLENQCSVADDPMENVSENTSVADHTYVKKESDHEGPDWLEQLLM